jgi:hypothetical protein
MTDEAGLAAERGQAVANAVRAGKIPLDAAPEWLARIKADPSKAAYLANLTAGYQPPHANPMRQALRPRTSPPAAPPVERVTREIELGGGLIKMQAELIGGKPHDQWTYEEGRDAALWQMGQRFRRGLKPPPEPQWHIPMDSVSHTTSEGTM